MQKDYKHETDQNASTPKSTEEDLISTNCINRPHNIPFIEYTPFRHYSPKNFYRYLLSPPIHIRWVVYSSAQVYISPNSSYF